LIKSTYNWLKLLFSSKVDPGRLYDLVGEKGFFGAKKDLPYANMGYWEEKPNNNYDIGNANQAMFDLVLKKAEINAEDQVVVDVGCGYGTAVVHCATHYHPKKTIGLNLSSVQLSVANKLVDREQVNDSVEFIHGSATKMPFEDASIDKIITIEAAFHFDSREAFFKEAFRVLKPGGILSGVDLLGPPSNSIFQRVNLRILLRTLEIPKVNVYGTEKFLALIEKEGFKLAACTSLTKNVIPPFIKWFFANFTKTLFHYNMVFSLSSIGFLFYPWDYINFVATKEG